MTSDTPPNSSPARPPQSRLAVVALALALVPCCPAIPLTGSMLGVLAHARIRKSGGRLRGERLALAAMLLGSVFALVEMILLERYIEGQADEQRTLAAAAVRASLDDSADGWPEGVVDRWMAAAGVDEATLRRDVAELETTLGPFLGIRLTGAQPAGRGLALARVYTGFLSAGGMDRPAVVECVVTQTPRAGAFGILPGTGVRLRSIRVTLTDGSTWLIGTPFAEDDESEAAPDPDTPGANGEAAAAEEEDG